MTRAEERARQRPRQQGSEAAGPAGMHCRCGRTAIRARGLCASCYVRRDQDQRYFGGLREAVLKRDSYRCRVCERPGCGKWSIVVHHREPGVSELDRMIALCPRHHGMVERTEVALAEMPPLLLELWRERHPGAHEQRWLNFRAARPPAAAPVSLFGETGTHPASAVFRPKAKPRRLHLCQVLAAFLSDAGAPLRSHSGQLSHYLFR